MLVTLGTYRGLSIARATMFDLKTEEDLELE